MENLTGKKFGRWTVLELCENNYYTCECECGKIKQVRGDSLIKGDSSSCGCLASEIKRGNYTDLVGKRFGRLLVKEKSENKKRGNKGKDFITFLCVCDCGVEKIVFSRDLIAGNTNSCGCLRTELSKTNYKWTLKKTIKDLTGKVVGLLKVERMVESSFRSGRSYSAYLCTCSCGFEKVIFGQDLLTGRVVSCGCLSESSIASRLKKYFKDKYFAIIEYRIVKNPDTGRTMPYDIYIPEKNIFIEVNGKQHYSYNTFFHRSEDDFLKLKKHDRIKRKYARKNGIYIEIDLRKLETYEEIVENIEKIIEGEYDS